MTAQRIDFLGLPLDLGLSVEGICNELRQKGRLRLIGYISPSSWAVAKANPHFVAALRQMTAIRAGGEGVARACRWLTGASCPRISFDMTSLADPFFKAALIEGSSIILVGGAPATDEHMEQKLKRSYPGLKVVGTAHGYGDMLPKVSMIVEQAPDVVIVGMGSPRQELFLLALRDAGYQGLAITCGGFFDQYVETNQYYPEWINRWNLRFAYRLYKEPRRLWRRYLIDYQLFILAALKGVLEKLTPVWVRRVIAHEKKA